ncbi:TPA: proline-specific permease ProY, partial [Haemophilus influenzae]
ITIFVWIIILFSNMFMNNNRLSSFIGFLQKNKFILFSIFSLVFIVLFMLLNKETRWASLVGVSIILLIFIIGTKFNNIIFKENKDEC